MQRPPRRDTEWARGIALITVLWLISLLTLLASAAVTLSLTDRRAAAYLEEAVQADLASDSAIRLAELHLFGGRRAGESWFGGGPRNLSVSGRQIELTLEREAGRIDLNDADPQLLFALLAANGWDESRARELASRIAAFRGDKQAPGTLDDRLRPAAESRRGRFGSVDQLRQIPEGESLSSELLESLTVYTHASEPLESAAPPPVERALKWADDHQLGGRRWRAAASTHALAADSAADTLVGQVVRIGACAQIGSQVRCRRAVIRPTGSPVHPLQVFEWSAAPP